MSRYIDLVLCHRGERRTLAEAPAFTHLKEGDQIRLLGAGDLWTVICSIPIEKQSDDYAFWRKALGQEPFIEGGRPYIPRVAARVDYVDMKWEDEDE